VGAADEGPHALGPIGARPAPGGGRRHPGDEVPATNVAASDAATVADQRPVEADVTRGEGVGTSAQVRWRTRDAR
jgi:hypothetical protein